jgi:hypothetical protein
MTHTPTPYNQRGENITKTVLYTGAEKHIGRIIDEIDAEFIVRACNAHDDLIAVLEIPMKMVDADMMFGLSEFDHLPYETVQAIARAALRIVGQRNQEVLAKAKSTGDGV